MLLKIELTNGVEIIANEVRENIEGSYSKAPVHTFSINLGKGNTLTTEELVELFGEAANIAGFKVYKRDHVLGEDGEEAYGEFELLDMVNKFNKLKGVYKDFYSKQTAVILGIE